MNTELYLSLLKEEIAPALGCTEPISIAYASAKAREALGEIPTRILVQVSRNILKNAMGVGIPGTDMVGLEIASSLGALGGDPNASLEVLHSITEETVSAAKKMVAEKGVEVALEPTEKKFFIRVTVYGPSGEAQTVIEDMHTNITYIMKNGVTLFENPSEGAAAAAGKGALVTIDGIYEFVKAVDWKELRFLQQAVDLNRSIAQEGLSRPYGLQVGRSIYESMQLDENTEDVMDYAVALTCAAADARMSGSRMPVMTSCGSGNQGITATLPVVALAERKKLSEEMLYRGLAMSCLVTIHVKSYIGRLSPLCGCGVGASIGACCAVTYLMGGNLEQIKCAIRNVIADVSGVICDGAKAGCALKIATAVASAYRCSMLALRNISATPLDGIVSSDVEKTIRNLGQLGTDGMADTDRVILDMMVASR